jgi:hypothetical protein
MAFTRSGVRLPLAPPPDVLKFQHIPEGLRMDLIPKRLLADHPLTTPFWSMRMRIFSAGLNHSSTRDVAELLSRG